MSQRKPILLTIAVVLVLAVRPVSAAEPVTVVQRVLQQTCYDCHDEFSAEGDLVLAKLPWDLQDVKVRRRWTQIYDRIAAGEMPPERDDLAEDDRHAILAALQQSIGQAEKAEIQQQGRSSLRRLTRSEYEDNLRDLLQLPHLDVAARLPEDRQLHGFTKVADSLDMSSVQLNAYLDAAQAALQQAVASGVEPPSQVRHRFTGTRLFPSGETFGGREAMFFARNNKMISSGRVNQLTPQELDKAPVELALFRAATWPYFGYPRGFVAQVAGEYRVRFSARAVRQLPGFRLVPAYDPLPISFRARQPSGADVSGDVRETGGWIDLQPESETFETTILLKAGETFEYSLLGLPVPFIRTDGGFFYDFPPMPAEGHRGAAFEWLEVAGPLSPHQWPAASHRVLFGELAIGPPEPTSRLPVSVVSQQPKTDARLLFHRFAAQVAGGPLTDHAADAYLRLIDAELDAGVPFGDAMLKGYQALLCSGHFLYLTNPRHNPTALASRLSHFLWNSRPDRELLQKNIDGKLANAEQLHAEVDRMILDPRFDRFVDNFTDQWLNLSDLRRDLPDIRLYPEYRKDDYLVDSMERETQTFFAAMIRDNLPIATIIDSDFTYLNDRLAAHYGLARQSGSAMRRVDLPAWSPYGGLLTQASVLKLTTDGTTTSPVKRGVWVMEKLLGQPPPPPPKSIPAIEPNIRGASTVRQLLAKHAAEASCAACHARFDPVGFALENFDVMGAWRDRYRNLATGEEITGIDRAGHPFKYHIAAEVDAAGRLLSGEQFEDVHELKTLLLAQPRQLARNLLHQWTLYATGAEVRFSDRAEIDSILDQCADNGYRARDLLHQWVASPIFTEVESTHQR